MRKVYCILLLFVILLSSGGMLLFYKVQQLNAQYDAWELLHEDDANLETLVLSWEDYNRYKLDEREICIEGEMYDVKSITFNDDTVELLAFHDEHEGNILSKIKHLLLLSPQNRESSSITHFISFIGVESHITLIKLNYHPILHFSKNVFYDSPSFLSFVAEVISPPPKA